MRRTNFEGMNCSVAQCLEVVGEWWSLLILRDVLLGVRRFDDFQARLGISRNVLNQRLTRLVEHGVLQRVRYQEHPPRHEYHLTDKGRDLWLVLIAMRQWGDKWAAPDGAPVDMVHVACGHVSQAEPTCSECHEILDVRAVRAVPGPGSRHPDLTSPEAVRATSDGTSAPRRQPRRRDSAPARTGRGPRTRGR